MKAVRNGLCWFASRKRRGRSKSFPRAIRFGERSSPLPPIVRITTLCAVAEDPSAFNNKLVRLRGHFSGNFEYSMLSGDNCEQALWFGYGGGGGPPSLAAYVPGGARPGAEDADGRLVLPVPVKLVRDSKFETFEKQVQAMSNADAAYEKNTQASSSNTV